MRPPARWAGRAPLTFRAFREADRVSCQALAARAALSSYGASMPDLAGRFSPSAPLEAAERRILATCEGRVIGFVELVGEHISNLFVDPDVQGRGVGDALMTEVERRIAGDLTLSVFTVNARARRFYERLGYRVEGTALTPFAGTEREVWRMRKLRPTSDAAARLAIFDFDGTLADSADWMIGALRQLAREYGFHAPSGAEIARLRGLPTRDVLRALRVPIVQLPSITVRLRKLSREAAGEIPLFPGADALFEALERNGVQMAVVSSNGEETVRAVLGDERAGFITHFACGASLLDKRRKFRVVLARAGVPASRVLAIGDELRDIEAGRRVGVATGAVTWGYATVEALERAGPDYLFAAFHEIAEAFGASIAGQAAAV